MASGQALRKYDRRGFCTLKKSVPPGEPVFARTQPEQLPGSHRSGYGISVFVNVIETFEGQVPHRTGAREALGPLLHRIREDTVPAKSL